MFWLVLQTFLLVVVAMALGIALGSLSKLQVGRPRPALAGVSGSLALEPAAGAGPTPAVAADAPSSPAADRSPSLAGMPEDPPPAVAAETVNVVPTTTPNPTPSPADEAPVDGPDAATGGPISPSDDVEPEASATAAVDAIIDAGKAAIADQVGVRPSALPRPRDHAADDLKIIKGIGPQNEARLNALGIFQIAQIARWSPEEARWVGAYLAFPGRIEREDWIGQARALSAG